MQLIRIHPAARCLGQILRRASARTLLIVLVFSLDPLLADAQAETVQARIAKPTWVSQITPLPASDGSAPRSIKLFYEGSWSRWVQAGSLQMSFFRSSGSIEATSYMTSRGAVRAIWPFESTTTSQISPRKLIPNHFEHVQTERGASEEYEADYRNGIMRINSIITPGDASKPERESRSYHLEQIRDVHSALLFLQRADLRPNRTVTLLVQPVDSLYLVSLEVAGRERRKVSNKQWNTIKLNVQVRKIRGNLKLAPYTKMRSATLWVSDDHYRIPVEIQTDLFIGFVSVRLVGHSVN